MANDEQIKVVITAEDKASGVLASFGDKAGGLAGILKGGLGIALGAVTTAFGVLGTVAYESIKAFDEQDKMLKQLDAVLASTHSAAGLTKDAVVELSKALQKQTAFSDEAVQSAENLLLTFTNIKGDTFKDATKVVLDMSVALGEDLKSASIQVGKALQDPILGVTALRRVGVNFNEAQTEMIKHLVETGHSLEAQKFILKELNTEFGGSAVAAANTFGGKMTQLKNVVNDLQEQIGSALITAITPFITQLAEFAQRPETQAQIQGIADKIAKMAIALTPLAQKLIPAMIEGLNISIGVINFLGKAFVATTDFLGTLIFKVMQFIDLIKDMVAEINKAIDAIARLTSKALSGGGLGFTNKIGDAISGFLGIGARASGGPVSAGMPYIVGEEGPELFVPTRGGSILPNGGGLGGVVVNITGTFLSRDAAEKMANMMIDTLKLELRI